MAASHRLQRPATSPSASTIRLSGNDPKDLHALEVERESGFDIRSVYQAHEQARGAHFAWVFAHAVDADQRIRIAANDLGVGVVVFSNPNSAGTYRMIEQARLRDDPDLAAFMSRCFPKGCELLNGGRSE